MAVEPDLLLQDRMFALEAKIREMEQHSASASLHGGTFALEARVVVMEKQMRLLLGQLQATDREIGELAARLEKLGGEPVKAKYQGAATPCRKCGRPLPGLAFVQPICAACAEEGE